jgi:hypothetical protein
MFGFVHVVGATLREGTRTGETQGSAPRQTKTQTKSAK